jgi:lipopolysaccharide/colanic/teichoic acid biosynthesis glycosyltransferase
MDFFIQERVGLGNSRFGLIKFSTMLKDSPETGTITAQNAPRILPVGRYLRALKINELPRILNPSSI